MFTNLFKTQNKSTIRLKFTGQLTGTKEYGVFIVQNENENKECGIITITRPVIEDTDIQDTPTEYKNYHIISYINKPGCDKYITMRYQTQELINKESDKESDIIPFITNITLNIIDDEIQTVTLQYKDFKGENRIIIGNSMKNGGRRKTKTKKQKPKSKPKVDPKEKPKPKSKPKVDPKKTKSKPQKKT